MFAGISKFYSQISNLNKTWNNNGFLILGGLCLGFLLLLALWYKITGRKGTYSKDGYIHNLFHTREAQKSRGPPKQSRGEIECRRVLEKIFQKRFSSQRPDFLRNPVTGGSFNLELDCYNSDLNLAVEYNGVQHYKFVPYFHRNHDHFMAQKYRDDMKRRLCRDNHVNLIEVPYSVKLEEIEGFLKREVGKLGYRV